MAYDTSPGITRKDPKPHKVHKNGSRTVLFASGEYIRGPGQDRIDLHYYLMNNSVSSYLMRMEGNAIRQSGLHDNSILIVEKDIWRRLGHIVVVRFNGNVIVRKLSKLYGRWCFLTDDVLDKAIYILPGDHVERMGIVRFAINGVR